MQRHDFSTRALAGAFAMLIVAGAVMVLAETSDAHFRAALAAAGLEAAQPAAVAIEPSRIDVVAPRDATRTAIRTDERSRPRG